MKLKGEQYEEFWKEMCFGSRGNGNRVRVSDYGNGLQEKRAVIAASGAGSQ